MHVRSRLHFEEESPLSLFKGFCWIPYVFSSIKQNILEQKITFTPCISKTLARFTILTDQTEQIQITDWDCLLGIKTTKNSFSNNVQLLNNVIHRAYCNNIVPDTTKPKPWLTKTKVFNEKVFPTFKQKQYN